MHWREVFFGLLILAAPLHAQTPPKKPAGNHLPQAPRLLVVPDAGTECGKTIEQVLEKAHKECATRRSGPLFYFSQKAEKKPVLNTPFDRLKEKNLEESIRFAGKESVQEVQLKLDDVIYLFSATLPCSTQSRLNKEVRAMFKQLPEVGEKGIQSEYDRRQLRHVFETLEQQFGQLERTRDDASLSVQLAEEMSRYRAQELSEQGCPLLAPQVDAGSLRDRILALHKRMSRKDISGVDELRKAVPSSEAALIELLYPRSEDTALAFDFAVGTDRANYFRNLLLNGEIPEKEAGYTLKSDSPKYILNTKTAGAVPASMRKGVESLLTHPGASAYHEAVTGIHKLRPAEVASMRRYLQDVLQRLDSNNEEGGLEGNLLSDRLVAEHLRTGIFRLLDNIDRRSPSDPERAAKLKDFLPAVRLNVLHGPQQDAKRRIDGRDLRRALSTPAPVSENEQEQAKLFETARAVSATPEKEKEYVRGVQLRMTKADYEALTSHLGGLEAEYRSRMDAKFSSEPHFYGRALRKERAKVPVTETPQAIDQIDERLAHYEIGLGAEDRLLLASKLSPFYQGLLAELIKDTQEGKLRSRKNDSRRWISPTPAEIGKILFSPEGKEDDIVAMALASRINRYDDAALLKYLEQWILKAGIKIPVPLSLSNAQKLTPEQRDQLRLLLEGHIEQTKDSTQMALMMASRLLREWNYTTEQLHPNMNLADPNTLDFSFEENRMADHAPLYKISRMIKENIAKAGGESTKSLQSVNEVAKHLKSHGYGLPLPAEHALLDYLLKSGQPADETIRTMMAVMPPKEFASFVAKLRPGSSALVSGLFSGAVKNYLPASYYLQMETDEEGTAFFMTPHRVQSRIVHELVETGKMSEKSLLEFPQLEMLYPGCRPEKEPKTEDEVRQSNQETFACMSREVYRQAAFVLIDRGLTYRAEKLLSPLFQSSKDAVAELKHLESEAKKRKTQEKALLDLKIDLASLLKNPAISDFIDRGSSKEIERQKQISLWNKESRRNLGNYLLDDAARRRKRSEVAEKLELAERLAEEISKKRRKAYHRLSDPEYERMDTLELELKDLRAQEAAERIPHGRNLKWKSANGEKLYKLVKAKEAQLQPLINKASVGQREFKPHERLQYDTQQAEIRAQRHMLEELTNQNRSRALQLLEGLDAAQDPAVLANDGKKPSDRDRFEAVLKEILSSSPDEKKEPEKAQLRNEILALIEGFTRVGKLAKPKTPVEGKEPGDNEPAYEDVTAEMEAALVAKIAEKIPTEKDKGLVSLRVASILETCEKYPDKCAASPSELEYLKELQAAHLKSKPGERDHLDREGSHDTLEALGEKGARKNAYTAAFRGSLAKNARQWERFYNKQDRGVILENLVKTQLQKQKKKLDEETIKEQVAYLGGVVASLDKGRALANLVATSNMTASEMPPSKPGRELDAWLAKRGFKVALDDWLYETSSGVAGHRIDTDKGQVRASHRLQEDQAKKLFSQMLNEAYAKSNESLKERQSIEKELAPILDPTHQRFAGGQLWNWATAKLHLLKQPWEKKSGMPIEKFLALLDRYADLCNADTHALDSEFAIDSKGRDEFYDTVQEAFLESNYDRDATAYNPHTWVTKQDFEKEHYVFEDAEKSRPQIEALAKDIQLKLHNNSQLLADLSIQGGAWEGAKRMWVGSETHLDKHIEDQMARIAGGISSLARLGSVPIEFQGDENAPAANVAQSLRSEFSDLLKAQGTTLANTVKGYNQAENTIYLETALAPLTAISAVRHLSKLAHLTRLSKAAQYVANTRTALKVGSTVNKAKAILGVYKLASKVKAGGRWAHRISTLPHLAKILAKIKSSYAYAKLGVNGHLFTMSANAAIGTGQLSYGWDRANAVDKEKADGSPGSNGIPDWEDALNDGRPYHFDKDVQEEIDKDNNGLPDLYDVTVRGMPWATYTTGSLTQSFDAAVESGKILAIAPWVNSLVGRAALRPIGELMDSKLGKVGKKMVDSGGRVKKFIGKRALEIGSGAPGTARMWEPAVGMWTTKFVQRNLSGEGTWLENAEEAAWDSVFMSPLDDWLAFKYLKWNPKAKERMIGLIKGSVNHGADFLQGMSIVYREGEYQNAAGVKTKEYWKAGSLSAAESWYQSAKASDPKNAMMDMLPKLLLNDVLYKSKMGEKNITHPLMDYVLTDKAGRGHRIKDLVGNNSNLEDFTKPKTHEAFFALFDEKLIAMGVPSEEIAKMYRTSLAKAGGMELRFGEVETFLQHIEREVKFHQLQTGEITAQNLMSAKSVWGGKANLHHVMTAGDTIANGEFKNGEVRKVVRQAARDFGLNPVKFSAYVKERVASQDEFAPAMTLRSLANEMAERDAAQAALKNPSTPRTTLR